MGERAVDQSADIVPGVVGNPRVRVRRSGALLGSSVSALLQHRARIAPCASHRCSQEPGLMTEGRASFCPATARTRATRRGFQRGHLVTARIA